MKELDGWRAQGRLLQFTFDKHLAEIYGAELISNGSYRLNTITRLIRKQGLLAQAHLCHEHFYEPNIRNKVLASLGPKKRVYVINNRQCYCQYLGLQLSVRRLGLQKKESLHFPMVNLSSGEVLLKFPISTHLFSSGSPLKDAILKKKISFKKAFVAAIDRLTQVFAEKDDSWAKNALDQLNKEKEKLDSFYEDSTDFSAYKHKTEELEKRLYPKLEITTMRVALLFIPLFHYRLMVVDGKGNEKTETLYYNPVSNLQRQG